MGCSHDGMFSGEVVLDQGSATTVNSTGAKNHSFSSPQVIPPGHYLLGMALGAITGTFTVAALSGVYPERPLINFPSGTAWNIATEYFHGANYTAGPPAAGDAMGLSVAALGATAGAVDGIDAPMLLEYESYY